MPRWIRILFAWALCLGCAPSFAYASAPAPVIVLSVDGAIGPATADYIHRGIDEATKRGAQLVVLRMDTPGGLDASMRAVVKDILAAPMPVAVFVGPGGARAASAGTYILYASHVAAMAPGTNLGAATPVQMGAPTADKEKPAEKGDSKAKISKTGKGRDAADSPDTLTRKVVHDAAAYIKGLAQLRGRNAEWGERAVREAVSLSAEDALKIKVIDLVAADVPELLKRLNGRKLTVAGAPRVLETASIEPTTIEPDRRTRFLSFITDPSIAYVLLLVGVYALMIEFTNPGLVAPGVVGALCLLIAAYGLHLMPVNYAGLALLLLGLALMVAEAFFPVYGSLGIGGVIAFVIGSTMLIDTDVPGYGVPIGLILGFAAASAAFLVFVIGMLLKARQRPVVSGREEMIRSTGEVLEDFDKEGWARVHGENWKVRSAQPLKAGRRVRVTGIDGLVLEVVPESEKGE